ncbi:MAG TPA: putative peptidoglycan glycosyltransferase FtsW [Bacillota bacterium]|nr:putative peptidoglycan glycosyltransferase FtsW [Bacillota bacterium]
MFEKNKDKSSSDTNEPAKTDKKKKSSDYIGAEVDFAKSGEVTGIRFLEPLRVNIWLSLLILLMTGFGLLMLFSASIPRGYTDESDPFYYVIRQGGFMLLGILIGAVISMLPIRLFDHIGFVIAVYTMTLGLAVATLFFGNVINGARRWVSIGSLSFQPSELIKVGLVFCVAGYRSFVQRQRKAGKLHYQGKRISKKTFDALVDIVIPGGLLLIVMAFVLAQPHVSCFGILVFVCGVCFFCSGISLSSWLRGAGMLFAVVAILVGIVFLFNIMDIQQKAKQNFAHFFTRIDIFNQMNSDETEEEESDEDDEASYQSQQSLIAIGSGGLTGVGLGNSRQKYQYLPEQHNDYIFSILCEELGFVGGAMVIVLFGLLLFAGMAIAWRANSLFSRILAVGYTSLLCFQAFYNIGVALSIVPPTGMTLPFFSYGGTANFFFMIAVGLLLSVSRSGVKRKSVEVRV